MLNFPKIQTLTDPAKRKMALSQFENTAMELAENRAGVTPLVVQVCNETSELLRDTVLSAIISEHDTDVAMLAQAFSAFDGAEAMRQEYEAEILAAIAAVYGPGGAIEQHIECRTYESQECVDCGECEVECETSTETCDDLEAELRLKYIDVIEKVNEDARCEGLQIIPAFTSETTINIADHIENKRRMEIYLAALAAYEACEETSTTHCTSCPTPPEGCRTQFPDTWREVCPCLNHTSTRTQCNTEQEALQQAQCQSRHLYINYMQLYDQAFRGALIRYQMVESQIRIMEADRKVEWDTLERVICLLMTLSIDEDGSASSVETANAIDNCRTQFVDTSHLDIIYPVPPGMEGLPDMPHSPCSQEFENDAYSDVPPFCSGNDELLDRYQHGLLTSCECNAEPPAPREVGFPYELGPFLMFDTGLPLDVDTEGRLGSFNGTSGEYNAGDPTSFSLTETGWVAHFHDKTYRGRVSPFAVVTLPDLDEAFGLEGDNVVTEVAWAYPDQEGTYDDYLAATNEGVYEEDMTHRFLRTGGFAYRNAANQIVALKEISPSPPTLQIDPFAQLTLTFDRPEGITEDQANHACPNGFTPPSSSEIRDNGGIEYCWDKSFTLSFCPHGCFIYRVEQMEGSGFLAFPLMESTAHLAPAHYAPTDQQGAEVASMITGVIAATNPPTEED
jgi:hypothetical protein